MTGPEQPNLPKRMPEIPELPSTEHLGFPEGVVFGYQIAILQQRFESVSAELERVTQERDRYRELAQSAITDDLTGKPNRKALTYELQALVEQQPENFGVLFVDLDGLKEANDSEGHEAGNELICKAAEVLDQNLRTDPARDPNDTIGRAAFRLAGDEFVGLLPGVNDIEHLGIVQERLQSAFDEAGVQASIGGSIHQDSQTPTEVMANADEAMYEAKSERREKAQIQAREQLLPEVREVTEEVVVKLGQVGLDVSDLNRLYGKRSR